jgi:hypothetical protein
MIYTTGTLFIHFQLFPNTPASLFRAWCSWQQGLRDRSALQLQMQQRQRRRRMVLNHVARANALLCASHFAHWQAAQRFQRALRVSRRVTCQLFLRRRCLACLRCTPTLKYETPYSKFLNFLVKVGIAGLERVGQSLEKQTRQTHSETTSLDFSKFAAFEVGDNMLEAAHRYSPSSAPIVQSFRTSSAQSRF